jgi:hypothetical protein
MLPKIVVSRSSDKEKIREKLGILLQKEISFETEGATVKDLRGWINFATTVTSQDKSYFLIIWDADKLSKECQAILLKPLEEKGAEGKYYLVVKKESGLLSTIISRCEVEKISMQDIDDGKYWRDMVSCWRDGPARCISFAEKFSDYEGVRSVFVEAADKLKKEIEKKMNQKRAVILKMAFGKLREMADTKVNPRLCLEDFLIQSWRVIGS